MILIFPQHGTYDRLAPSPRYRNYFLTYWNYFHTYATTGKLIYLNEQLFIVSDNIDYANVHTDKSAIYPTVCDAELTLTAKKARATSKAMQQLEVLKQRGSSH